MPQRVMEMFNLGPNGSLVYCMEYLEANLDWLVQRILATTRLGYESVGEGVEGERTAFGCSYLIFDCPGQVCAIQANL
jgi:hypothetical protein